MLMVRILTCAVFVTQISIGVSDDLTPADATMPEQIQVAIAQLDAPSFQQREEAVDVLFDMGVIAVSPLKDAAQNGSCEVAVRAFDVLQRLYFRDDEPTNEAVDVAFRQLMHVDNLSATSRAERMFESVTEIRQTRAVAKLERLGAIVHLMDSNFERQRPRIDHVMFGRDWVGSDEDVRLIERIEDLRLTDNSAIYIVRGVNISEDLLSTLKANLPSLNIQRRGPARLGVTNSRFAEGGCFIGIVEPNSAADGAGLKPSDQIVEIGGKPVNSFEQLIEAIGEKEPGDLVPIIFLRDNEIHEVEAKLSAWTKKNSANPPQPKP